MKVVGIGSPTSLRIRPRRCEIGVLRDVLYLHLDHAVERKSAEVEAALTALLDQLRDAEANEQPVVLVGPTPVVAAIVRNAASEAVERLSVGLDVLIGDAAGAITPEQLRAAADAAGACTATLIHLIDVQGEPAERIEVADAA